MEPYPNIDEPDFQFLIGRRLEFRDLRNIDGLYPHQEFVRRFLSPYTPYESLIVYHTLGSGKSIACIAVAVDHYLHDGKRCIIVTKGDTGTANFVKQVNMYHEMCSTRDRWNTSVFEMKHYISLSNQVSNMSDDDVANAFSNSVLILDEVHNVRYMKKAVESSVYGSIIRLLRLCTNVRLIIATATPMTDSPYQINSIVGLCNHSRLDRSAPLSGIISYNEVMRDVPVPNYVGTFEYIPYMRVYPSYMKKHQEREYKHEYGKQPPDDIYKKLTHISLFCFPDGTYGKNVTDTKMAKTRIKTLITGMSTKHTKEIKYTKYSIHPEFKDFLCGPRLAHCGSKYAAMMTLLENSLGNVFVFLEEVKGSGLLLLASILESHGYELYIGEDISNMPKGKRYTMCVGSLDICPNNVDRLEGFNSDLNKNGEYVKVLLGSRVIGESITLNNVRSFHCLTPHWNDSTVDQAIGRVVRNGSHKALDPGEHTVDIYIHVSIFEPDPRGSVDIKKLEKCKDKEVMIKEVSELMISYAVDKYINDANVPVTHFLNFAAAYLHNMEAHYTSSVSDHFVDRHESNIDAIADEMGVDMIVCKEALCRMILRNVKIGNNRFLRAYGDTVFTVTDPSLPFVMVPNADEALLHHWHIASRFHGMHVLDLKVFRYMPVKHKIAYVEDSIARGMRDVLAPISTVYANIDGHIYHLLMYRDVDSSYSSSTPVPKVPLGKTRVFDSATRTWEYVESHDERHLLDRYRTLVSDLLDRADVENQIYGVISTIDGDMRLRLRATENVSKSLFDGRYVKRGRSLKSISKQVLLNILSMVNGTNASDSMTINDAVTMIDDALVRAGLYVVL